MKRKFYAFFLVLLIVSLTFNIAILRALIENEGAKQSLWIESRADVPKDLITRIRESSEVTLMIEIDTKIERIEETYSLEEDLSTNREFYSFRYENSSNSTRSCRFSSDVYDKIIELIIEGNPQKYKPFDENGNWRVSYVGKLIQVRTKDEQGNDDIFYIKCDNFSAICREFVEMYKYAGLWRY